MSVVVVMWNRLESAGTSSTKIESRSEDSLAPANAETQVSIERLRSGSHDADEKRVLRKIGTAEFGFRNFGRREK